MLVPIASNSLTTNACGQSDEVLPDLYSALDGFDGDVDRLSYVSHNCYRGQTILPAEDVPF